MLYSIRETFSQILPRVCIPIGRTLLNISKILNHVTCVSRPCFHMHMPLKAEYAARLSNCLFYF